MAAGSFDAGAAAVVLPLVVTASFAAVIVIARHRREVSMMPATCASQVLVVAACLPFRSLGSASRVDWLVLAALGVGQMGVGLAFLTVGARLIPPAQVALISLLEVVLGPLWVWLAYASARRRRPSRAARSSSSRSSCRRSARAGRARARRPGPHVESGSRRAGRTLPGFMIPIGSKSCLTPRISGIRSPCSCCEGADLADPDAVLAGARAAAGERVVDERAATSSFERPSCRRIVGVDRRAPTWRLPSPAWPRIAAVEPEPVELRAGERAPRRRARRRGTQTSVVRSPACPARGRHGVGGVVPRLPEPRARGRVTLERRSSVAPSASRERLHELEIVLDRLGAAASTSTKRHGSLGERRARSRR